MNELPDHIRRLVGKRVHVSYLADCGAHATTESRHREYVGTLGSTIGGSLCFTIETPVDWPWRSRGDTVSWHNTEELRVEPA